MTCSKKFGKLLQVSCLGLIGTLTVVGCGGSEVRPPAPDSGIGEVGPFGKPNLNASSATVSVGTSVEVGKVSTPVTVTITNTGTAAGVLTVTPAGVGIAATGCTGSLAVNAPCTLSITATPPAAGAISGNISVAAAGGNTVLIGVTGGAVTPGAFTLSATVLPLGDIAVGDTRQATIVVTANAALTGLTTGVQGADLKVDALSNCTGTLAAGASCNVVVNFSSTTPGSPIGDAIVVGQGGVTRSVQVTANVLAPAKLAATPIAGALVAVPGSVSTTNLEINVGNIGGMTTGTLAVAIVGVGFNILTENCSIVTLANAKFCTVTVQYAPAATVVAAQTASLTITDKGPGASVATVALSGTPTPATPPPPPSTLTLTGATTALGSVAPGASGAEVLFTVTNTSATPSGALTAALVPSASITISSNACAAKATLALNETCTIGLKLTPAAAATPQAVSAALTVTGAAAKNPVSITVTGAIVTGGTLSATPTSVNFSSIPVNQLSAVQSVTIKNTGATATGVLSVTLSGTGAAQVAVTGNTCTGTLASAATCTVAVQYSPTDTTGVVGTITVTDGTASAAIPMAGTGLTPSTIVVGGDNPRDFLGVVLGTTSGPQTFTVDADTGATTSVGTVAAAITGDALADFAIKSDTNTCSTIQPGPGQSCTFEVTFAPSVASARTATLTVTASKGGTYQIVLKGTGLAVVEILSVNPTPTPPATGLDFGQVPVNSTATAPTRDYKVVVRGPIGTAAAPLPTTMTVALSDTAAPTNFSYPAGVVTNRCTGAILDLASATHPIVGSWTYDSTAGIQGYACTFTVQFKPQSTKGDKTATITATGSASGTPATKTLTGIATGPLKFAPSPVVFSDTIVVGDSTNQLTIDAGTTRNVTVTLDNTSATTAQGPIQVSLGGTNADQFRIVTDECSFATLPKTPDAGHNCPVVLAFVPTSDGPKTAVLTATAGTGATLETATVSIQALAGPAMPIQVNGSLTPAAVDFGTVVQTKTSAWVAFTVTNPATATTSAQIGYSIASASLDYVLADNSASAPYGTCGANGTTQLVPGNSCTILAQFQPKATDVLNTNLPGTLTVNGGGGTVSVVLKGKASSQLTISPASHDFGSVGQGALSTPFTLTVTNNGAAAAAVVLNNAGLPPFQFVVTGCGSVAAGGNCTVVATYAAQDTVGGAGSDLFLTATIASTTATASAELKGKTVSPANLVAVGLNSSAPDGSSIINLGGVRKGETSGDVTLLFQNTGSVATSSINYLWQGGTANTADIDGLVIVSETATGCVGRTSLAAGATCTVTVHFTPTSGSVADAVVSKNFTLSADQGGRVGIFKLTATVLSNTTSAWYATTTGARAFFAFPGMTQGAATQPATLTGPTQVFQFTNGTAAVINVSAVLAIASSANFVVNGVAPGSQGSAPCSAITGTTPVVAANGGNCTFAVTFQPTPAWLATTAYRWATIGTGSSTLGLFGTVQSPAQLTLTPTPDNFGQIVAGTTSAAQNFTVTNVGQTASGVISITKGGADSALFIVGGACTAALAPGATCVGTVAVAPGTTIDPTLVGSLQATDGTVSSAVVPLAAAGVFATTLGLVPNSLTFPATQVGTTSTALTVTVSNAASAKTSGVLTGAVVDSTNFSVTGGTCKTTFANATPPRGIAAGESCTVTVVFMPQTLGTGTFTTDLTITGTNGEAKTVPITATAVSALTFTTPATSPVVLAGSATYTVTLAGGPQTGYLTTSMTGTSYFISDDNCVATKLGGALPTTCTITVDFVASSATPTKTGTLTVSGGSAGQTATLVINSQ